MYKEEAIELSSVIVNLWEHEKDFSLVVSAVQEFLVDQNTAFQGKLEQLETRIEELAQTMENLK